MHLTQHFACDCECGLVGDEQSTDLSLCTPIRQKLIVLRKCEGGNATHFPDEWKSSSEHDHASVASRKLFQGRRGRTAHQGNDPLHRHLSPRASGPDRTCSIWWNRCSLYRSFEIARRTPRGLSYPRHPQSCPSWTLKVLSAVCIRSPTHKRHRRAQHPLISDFRINTRIRHG